MARKKRGGWAVTVVQEKPLWHISSQQCVSCGRGGGEAHSENLLRFLRKSECDLRNKILVRVSRWDNGSVVIHFLKTPFLS